MTRKNKKKSVVVMTGDFCVGKKIYLGREESRISLVVGKKSKVGT